MLFPAGVDAVIEAVEGLRDLTRSGVEGGMLI